MTDVFHFDTFTLLHISDNGTILLGAQEGSIVVIEPMSPLIADPYHLKVELLVHPANVEYEGHGNPLSGLSSAKTETVTPEEFFVDGTTLKVGFGHATKKWVIWRFEDAKLHNNES